jgi:ankyrin repeat protein
MPKKLSDKSTLENFKKEAKRWLTALRSGDATARARLETAVPDTPAEPSLRDVQHALAVEYGFSGWSAFKQALEDPHAPFQLTELLDAAVHGEVARVAAILDADPTLLNQRGLLTGHAGLRTALHHAVSGPHASVVKLLLDRGADPNIRDEGDNAIPLHFAAEKEHLEIIRQPIEHGSDPIGAGDHHELEIIGWATVFGSARADVVEYLLSRGARHNIYSAVVLGDAAAIRDNAHDIDRPMDRTNRRRRPLHLAIVKNQPASLATLLSLGADTAATDASGLTPFDQAALAGRGEMIRLLREHGAAAGFPASAILSSPNHVFRDGLRPEGQWGRLIIRAAEQSPGPVIDRLIQNGASVNVMDTEETAVDGTSGYTPLHAAAFHGNIDAARVLLAHGARVTTLDSKYHGTPAGWAHYAGHHEVRDLILRGPIDFFEAVQFDLVDRLREIFDRTPASLNEPLARQLAREPAPHEPTKSWWTPLALAVVSGKLEMARGLLELGARTTVKDPDGRTLVELARAAGREDMAELLIEYAPPTMPAYDATSRDQLVARFLTNACPDHHVRGGWSHAVARDTALRLYEAHPDIARENIYTAVVCGDIEEVRRILAANPNEAHRKGGPKGSAGAAGTQFVVDPLPHTPPFWEPILYLSFARFETLAAGDNAVEIARLLLDHGADPNAYFMAGSSRYSPLTGVIGEGEEDRRPHPQRDALTKLLLERGAEPFDVQVFYNLHFHGRVLWYLKLIYEHTVNTDRADVWKDPRWPMIGMGGYGEGARYLLGVAINHGDTELAEWLLSHGADPNAPPPDHKSQRDKPQYSLYELAIRRGSLDVADVLAAHGATIADHTLSDEQRYVALAMLPDREELRTFVHRRPELLNSTDALFRAAEADRTDVIALLLDLGTPVNVHNHINEHALHMAAYNDAVNAAQLLIDRGSEVDPVESNWNNTPLDAAIYGQHDRMIALLGRYSRDVWSLTFIGQIDRLRELFREKPERAKATWEGMTPLTRLPGDDDRALEVAKLFVEFGAETNVRHQQGLTAAEIAERRGLTRTAEFLRTRRAG